jgi:hypothetical protein
MILYNEVIFSISPHFGYMDSVDSLLKGKSAGLKHFKTSFLFTLSLQKIAEIKNYIYKAIKAYLFIKCIYFHSLTKLVGMLMHVLVRT